MDQSCAPTSDPATGGRPIIRGMRIRVSDILGYLAAGDNPKSCWNSSPNWKTRILPQHSIRNIRYDRAHRLLQRNELRFVVDAMLPWRLGEFLIAERVMKLQRHVRRLKTLADQMKQFGNSCNRKWRNRRNCTKISDSFKRITCQAQLIYFTGGNLSTAMMI